MSSGGIRPDSPRGTSTTQQPETPYSRSSQKQSEKATFRRSKVKKKGLRERPLSRRISESDSEQETSHARSRSRSPHRLRTRKSHSPRPQLKETRDKPKVLSPREIIHREISDAWRDCRSCIRSRDFEGARKITKAIMAKHGWHSARMFGEEHRFPPDAMRKLLELDDMMMALVIIAKHHQPGYEKSFPKGKKPKKTDKLEEKPLQAPDTWNTALRKEYESLDWNDFRKSVIFVDCYLLNDDMHIYSGPAEKLDRTRAAHRHLMWSLNSRVLKNSAHPQWLDCYTKVCEQLPELDSAFAESPEGKQAIIIAELVARIRSAPNVTAAFDELKKYHQQLIRQNFNGQATLALACASRALSVRWLHDRQLTDLEDPIRQQNNTFFYGSTLLAFGPRCYRDAVHWDRGRKEFEQFTQHIVSLGRLGIPIQLHQQVMRSFTLEFLQEKNFADDLKVQRGLAKHLSNHCGIFLDSAWLVAMEAINNRDFDTARGKLDYLAKEARSKAEKDVVNLTEAYRCLCQKRPERAREYLQELSPPDGYYLNLETARLLHEAGNSERALRLIKGSLGIAGIIAQIPYIQLQRKILGTAEPKGIKPAEIPAQHTEEPKSPVPETSKPAPKKKRQEPSTLSFSLEEEVLSESDQESPKHEEPDSSSPQIMDISPATSPEAISKPLATDETPVSSTTPAGYIPAPFPTEPEATPFTSALKTEDAGIQTDPSYWQKSLGVQHTPQTSVAGTQTPAPPEMMEQETQTPDGELIDIEGLQQQHQLLQTEKQALVDSYSSEATALKKQLADLEAEKSGLQEQLKTNKKELEKLKKKNQWWHNESARIKAETDKFKEDLRKQNVSLKERIKTLTSKQAALQSEQPETAEELTRTKESLEQLKKAHNEETQRHFDAVGKLHKASGELQQQLTEKEALISELRQLHGEEKSKQENELKLVRGQVHQLEDQARQHESRIAQLQQNIADNEEVERIIKERRDHHKMEASSAKQQCQEIEAEKQVLTKKITSLNEQRQQQQTEIESLNIRIATLVGEQECLQQTATSQLETFGKKKAEYQERVQTLELKLQDTESLLQQARKDNVTVGKVYEDLLKAKTDTPLLPASTAEMPAEPDKDLLQKSVEMDEAIDNQEKDINKDTGQLLDKMEYLTNELKEKEEAIANLHSGYRQAMKDHSEAVQQSADQELQKLKESLEREAQHQLADNLSRQNNEYEQRVQAEISRRVSQIQSAVREQETLQIRNDVQGQLQQQYQQILNESQTALNATQHELIQKNQELETLQYQASNIPQMQQDLEYHLGYIQMLENALLSQGIDPYQLIMNAPAFTPQAAPTLPVPQVFPPQQVAGNYPQPATTASFSGLPAVSAASGGLPLPPTSSATELSDEQMQRMLDDLTNP